MNRTDRLKNNDIQLAILEAPKVTAGEEFHAFPDVARGIDEKVIIKEVAGRTIEVTDGRSFTRDQLLNDKEAAIIRRKFSGRRFAN